MAKLSQDDIKNVKGQGFLINRGTEMFSGRVLPGNGVFTAKEMRQLFLMRWDFAGSNPCTPKRNGDAGGGFAEQSA